jgi:hypothetical protein
VTGDSRNGQETLVVEKELSRRTFLTTGEPRPVAVARSGHGAADRGREIHRTPDGRYTAHTLQMLGPYARLRLTGPDLFLFRLEIHDTRGSQSFVSEMARRYDGHR